MRAVTGASAIILVLLLTVSGCASDGSQAPERKAESDSVLRFDIDLDGTPTTRLTHRVTGASVSTGDTCQAYNQAPRDIEFLYDFLACTHIAVLIGTAPAGTDPPEPGESVCALLVVPADSSRLKQTLIGYCAENPAQPLGSAVGLYWDESLSKGSFD